ncbi:MAG TPA: helix-turn-helix domain-containing protein [Thermomicrobiales bacterium]
MSDESIIKVRRLPDGTVEQLLPNGTTQVLIGQTDWARVDAMTEEEADAAALADPDNPLPTDDELARFQRIPSPKRIRQRLRLTQEQFAARFQVPLGTLREWEQGVREPDPAAKTLLRVIEKDPDAVVRALAG